jgi:hypothetical protein
MDLPGGNMRHDGRRAERKTVRRHDPGAAREVSRKNLTEKQENLTVKF